MPKYYGYKVYGYYLYFTSHCIVEAMHALFDFDFDLRQNYFLKLFLPLYTMFYNNHAEHVEHVEGLK